MLETTGVGVGVSLAWCQAPPQRNPEPPDAWTLTVDITAAGQDWTVRIAAGTGIALVIDWGDGLIERFYAIGNKTHIYNQQGRYYPKISGGFASGGIIRFGEIVGNRARLKATSIVPMIPGLATFSYTFQSCTGLTSLPADLFRYNTAVSASGFAYTFQNCTGLTSLPADLFRYNTAVSTSGFYGTFQNCTRLTSLPADLFRYNTAVSTSGFNTTFQNCTGLTSLPADLFRYNTAVSTAGFYSTFYGCAGLTSLPDALFQYNVAVSMFGFNTTFQNCTGLTSLPDALFQYNVAVSMFGFHTTFQNCTGLTSLPADLFRYNIACTSFNNVFQNCNKLQLRSDIFFPAGGETTRFLNQSVDFTNAMSIGTFTGTQGTAPALWDCTYGTGTPTTTTCFTGHSLASVTNYASIPTAWGGA